MRDLTVRTARWSARHPWRAVAAWFLFVALCLGTGLALGNNAATAEDFRVGEAGRAEAMATAGGLQRRPTEHVLIRAASGPLDRPAAEAAARDVRARMAKLPEVAEVGQPVPAADGTALRIRVVLHGPELEGRKNVVPLLEQTARAATAHPGVVVEETGSPAISKGVNDQRGRDLALSERITLPITVVTLLLVFGSVAMAAVPLLLALTSIAAALGLSMAFSHLLPDAGVGTNLILLIGLAVGVDYALFFLKREREERARSAGRLGPEALVELAAATAGRTIVTSGLAVIAATATLYLATDVIFSSLATGTVLVVATAMAGSVTVLPALLVKTGQRAALKAERRAARGRSAAPGRRLRRRSGRVRTGRGDAHGNGRLLRALLVPARRHPAATVLASVLFLLALAAPALGMKLVDPGKDTFSRGIPAMRAYDRLTTAFPELLVEHEVVVRAAPGRAADVRRALTALDRRAQADPLFAPHPAPRLRTSPDRRVHVLSLAVAHPAPSPEAVASLARIRTDLLPATVGALPGVESAVSGDVARGRDYVADERDRLPLVVGALLLMSFLTMALAFRSVVVALLGVLLNLLSAAASLGALVLVFQGTWAEGLLGFDSLGAIASRVPLFLLVILFGLSTDYQMFVVSRIREARAAGLPPREAVLHGIGASAKVVTSAAVVMVTVFGAFVALHLTEMKQMGFCLALAVLLDTVVIRLLILPAALLLLGERAWWPRRPAVRHPAPAQEALEKGEFSATAPARGHPADVR
ncbi:MMPL family transporter [Streptomyces sp. NPDC089919]|uniref:MMPL family transporter n=1 Tax=Streptomyces sp. NPDC089919 TaxID=3155188 RepID=UPI0034416947